MLRAGLMISIVCGALAAAVGQTVMTATVQDTVYRADGSVASGSLIVSWPAFTTAANAAIAAGNTTVQIGADGFVSLNLAPNAGALPSGTYYTAVFHLNDGTVNKEYWVVPAVATTKLSAIRSELAPATVAIQAVSKQYVDAAVRSITGSYLSAAGATMSGPLVLSGDPTSAAQAADKHYVDSAISTVLPVAGGTLTGALTLAADPTAPLQAATKEYVDASPGNATAALAAANAAQATANAAVPASKVGAASGVAPLDGSTRVPAGNMPAAFPASVHTEVFAGSPAYGAVCNWNGTTGADDTAALKGAIAAAVNAAAAKNYQQGTQVVLVPTGTCRISGELRIPANVTLRGLAKEGSIIEQTNATANAVTVVQCSTGFGGSGGPFGDCEGGISDLTIEGNGHSTTGTLVEIDGVVSYRLQNVRLYNGGGRGLQMNGNSERLESRDLTIMQTRWPLVIAQDSNESYFYNTKVIYPGQTADGYCYNVNCLNGVYPSSGAITPDPHAAVYNYMGVNVGFYGGSIKSLQMMGGFKTFNSESTSVDHFYLEYGYVNPGIIAGGVPEWTTTTAAMTATSLSVPVASTQWMPQYFNSPGDVRTGDIAYNKYVILPPDFLWGSSAASSMGGGITRGTYEIVGVAGFAGDGKFYIGTSSRGLAGTTAQTWPAGAIVEARPIGVSSFKVSNSHVNEQDSFSALGAAGVNLTRTCDNSGVNTCAEIIEGYIPDGRWVQQRGNPGDNQTAPQTNVTLSNLSMFTGALAGVGVVAVHSNTILELDGVSGGIPAGEGNSVPYSGSIQANFAGSVVSVPTYANGHQALLTLVDNSNHRTMSTTGGMYKQTVAIYDANGHTSVGDQIASEYDLMDLPYWATTGTPSAAAGGSLAAGEYSVRVAYTYASGVGIVSPSTMVAVGAGQGQFTVPSPSADAAGLATGWNVYVGTSGNENLQNSLPLPIGTNFTLSATPVSNLGILPLGCSGFCHPLYRFQFLGGPNNMGANAGFGLHKWNSSSSAWQTLFNVNGNGNGNFAGGLNVMGGTATDTLTAGQINKVFYVDGYQASGCVVGATTYTTQLDCATATANAWIAANNAGAKLVLGSGSYNTCTGILLPSLNGYFGTLSIQGASQEQTIISQSCPITNPVIYHADAVNGNLSRVLLRDFRVNANKNAPSCMDIFGVNESKIENINCSGANGTDHFMKIGDTPANGANGAVYQTPVSNVYITGNPLPTFASVTANVVSGSVTSYTVTSGGSGYGSTTQVYLFGYGYSKNPCQVMPTATATVAGGVVTAVTPVTTGSNCSGAITVTVASLPAAAYGIVFGNFTDNTLYDVATGGVGTTAAIQVLEGDNVFYHFHPNGGPVGVSDYGNVYYGTECDSMYQYCFDIEGGTGIFGTTFTWNNATAYPISAGYYLAPNAFNAKIVGSMQCLTNVPSGYVQFWNQYGPVTSALPSGVTVLANRACSGTSQTLFGEPVYLNATNRATATNNYFSQPLYFADSFWNNIAPVNDPWQVVVGGTPSGTPTFENLNFYAPVNFYNTFQPSFKLSYNTPATAGLNYNSPGWDLNASYWDGSQSQSSDWIVKQSLGSGVNPVSTLSFTPTKTGSTALQAQVVVPSLQIVPGTATQPACNAGNRALHWFVQGTPDHEQVCVQTATAGSYAWVQIF